MREYMFHLAFENENSWDYVTEKPWQARRRCHIVQCTGIPAFTCTSPV